MPVFSLVNSLKCCKQIRHAFLLYTDTGVGNIVDYLAALFIETPVLDGKGYRTLGSVFYRIVQDIDKYLLYPDLISVKLQRKLGIHINMEFEAFFLYTHPEHADNLGDHLSHVVFNGCQLHFA